MCCKDQRRRVNAETFCDLNQIFVLRHMVLMQDHSNEFEVHAEETCGVRVGHQAPLGKLLSNEIGELYRGLVIASGR